MKKISQANLSDVKLEESFSNKISLECSPRAGINFGLSEQGVELYWAGDFGLCIELLSLLESFIIESLFFTCGSSITSSSLLIIAEGTSFSSMRATNSSEVNKSTPSSLPSASPPPRKITYQNFRLTIKPPTIIQLQKSQMNKKKII